MTRRLFSLLGLAAASLLSTSVARADDASTSPPPAKEDAATTTLDRVVRPFLWRLEGETPSWLFGTAHVVDDRVTTLHPLARAAFDEAQAAYFEVDLIKDGAAQMKALELPAGQTTAEHVPAELLARLDAHLAKISPQLSHSFMPKVQPAAWGILVGSLREQLKRPGVPMLDAKLFGEAMRAGKTVGGLERPAEQTTIFRVLNMEDQLLMLRLSLDALDAAAAKQQDPTAALLEHYLAGDEVALAKFAEAEMTGDGQMPERLKALVWKHFLVDRNERIAKKIAELRKAHPERKQFFAVGAMHMATEGSVIDFLVEEGIRVVRVEPPAVTGEASSSTTKEEPAEVPREREPVGAK